MSVALGMRTDAKTESGEQQAIRRGCGSREQSLALRNGGGKRGIGWRTDESQSTDEMD